MAIFRVSKVVATLPATLTADTLYIVRVGDGFDLYCTDTTGNIAHTLNSTGDALNSIIEIDGGSASTTYLSGVQELDGGDARSFGVFPVADTADTDSETIAFGNVLLNDENTGFSALIVSAVNGLSDNVGQIVAGSNGGEFVINADGSWTFDPSGDFAALSGSATATTSVSYHASNGEAEASATLTVTVSSVVDSDPYWASVKLLIQPAADAADESTIITDVTGKFVYKSGVVRIKTTLGYPAIYFPGGVNDWLAINQVADYTACAPGTGDFTVDMLLYPLAYGGTVCGPTLFGTVYQSTSGYAFHLGQNQSSLRLTSKLTGTWADNLSVGTNGGPALNTLSHIAIERYGNTLTIYKNGAIVAQMTGVSAWNFAAAILRIGVFNDGNGDNLRVLRGYLRAYRVTHAARWRGVAFTGDVPAYPFPTA